MFGYLDATKDIAAPHHDPKFDTELGARRQICGKTFDSCLIDTKAIRSRQRLTGDLDYDATIGRATHVLRSPIICDVRDLIRKTGIPLFGIMRPKRRSARGPTFDQV